jgi:hypothetical protein
MPHIWGMFALLTAREVDTYLRHPRGRALRLARQGKLPAITLPDGEVRFKREAIEAIATEPAQPGNTNRGATHG